MSALEEIAAERKRQIEEEGYTAAHDDQYRSGQLEDAAARYAAEAGSTLDSERLAFLWPWPASMFKPAMPRQMLVKAGALIVAAIERLDREEASEHKSWRDGNARWEE